MQVTVSDGFLSASTNFNLSISAVDDSPFTENINLLSGVRLDKHSLLEDVVLSPRVSFLYKLQRNSQFRVSYSTGFRAPQAFDADLHIAFAGGGVSRIMLLEGLKEERSKI